MRLQSSNINQRTVVPGGHWVVLTWKGTFKLLCRSYTIIKERNHLAFSFTVLNLFAVL